MYLFRHDHAYSAGFSWGNFFSAILGHTLDFLRGVFAAISLPIRT
jgi:hypothetical protein